ncbi:MAG: DUF3137 domain-containing protein [Pseudomonadota bacterium]
MSLSASAGDAGSNAHFSSDFLNAVRPQLNALESVRLTKLDALKSRRRIGWPAMVLLGPLCLVLDFMFIPDFGFDDRGMPWLTVTVLGGIWAWVEFPKWQYAQAYKREILPRIAKLFGDFSYDHNVQIEMDAMQPSKIVPRHSAYKSEDHFAGNYKAVGIQFSEIDLTEKSGKTERSVFSGLAILLTSGVKTFHGHTIIVKDQGRLKRWFKAQTGKLKRADLVDPEFEQLFDVFTNDQVEARYLVDPRIMENLKSLFKDYDGKNLSAAFYDQYVLILIESSKDHFEPSGIHTPAIDEHALLAMRREIEQILSIIDHLSLYDRKARRRASSTA